MNPFKIASTDQIRYQPSRNKAAVQLAASGDAPLKDYKVPPFESAGKMKLKYVDAGQLQPPKVRKYRNEPVVRDGQRFDSKLESNVYDMLCAQYGKENVICQASIPVGNLRIRPDFMVIHDRFSDGRFWAEFVDAKGVVTRDWTAKCNHLRDKHGLTVRQIRKAKK